MKNRLEKFYEKFAGSRISILVAILVVLLSLVFFPTGSFIADVFATGPIIAGPYIMLALMLIVFALYFNFFLYVYIMGMFILSILVSIIGIGIGRVHGTGVLMFFVPILIFLFFNMFVGFFTYKYKNTD